LAVLLVAGAGFMAKTIISPAQQIQHVQHTFRGNLELSDVEGLSQYLSGENCSGSGGYADVTTNAQVTVLNEANVIVGNGRLSSGVMQGGVCVFSFTMSKVSDSNVYQIEVGSENRGKQRYSRTDAQAIGYQFALSLGNGARVPERPSCPVISDITTKVKMTAWQAWGDVEVGKSFASYTLDIANQASVEVSVDGEVVARFPNGKVESNSFTQSTMAPGFEYPLDDKYGGSRVDAPTSWGKPRSLTVKLLSVTTDALCQ